MGSPGPPPLPVKSSINILFETFFVISCAEDPDALPANSLEGWTQAMSSLKPRIIWRIGNPKINIDTDVLQFCIPEPQFMKPCNIDRFPYTSFSFAYDDKQGFIMYGFCRYIMHGGPGGRYDAGRCRVPEVMCILSKFPFYSFFHQLLVTSQSIRLLYQAGATLKTIEPPQSCSLYRLEQLLTALRESYHLAGLEQQILDYKFTIPSDLITDFAEIPTTPLLALLGPRLLVQLFCALVTERRIIFVSDDEQALRSCIHACVAMLYPLSWCHPFVPLLPASLLHLILEPQPYIYGIRHQVYRELENHSIGNVVFVFMQEFPSPPRISQTMGHLKVVDLCVHVKEKSTAQKLEKAYTFAKTRFADDSSSNSQADAIGSLVSELNGIQARCKQQLFNMITKEDLDLQIAMITFILSLLGDTDQLHLKEQCYLKKLYMKRQEKGDIDSIRRLLDSIVQTKMFSVYYGYAYDGNSTDADSNIYSSKRITGSPPQLFIGLMKLTDGVESNSTVKKIVSQNVLKGNLGQDDPSLHIRAAMLTLNQRNGTKSGSLSYRELEQVELLCLEAMESTKYNSIMRVIWVRIRDFKPRKWRRSGKALWLLKKLLLWGPETVLGDALVHFEDINFIGRQEGFGLIDSDMYRSGESQSSVSSEARGCLMLQAMVRSIVVLMMNLKRLGLEREYNDKMLANRNKLVKRPVFEGQYSIPDFGKMHDAIGEGIGGRVTVNVWPTKNKNSNASPVLSKPKTPPQPAQPPLCPPLSDHRRSQLHQHRRSERSLRMASCPAEAEKCTTKSSINNIPPDLLCSPTIVGIKGGRPDPTILDLQECSEQMQHLWPSLIPKTAPIPIHTAHHHIHPVASSYTPLPQSFPPHHHHHQRRYSLEPEQASHIHMYVSGHDSHTSPKMIPNTAPMIEQKTHASPKPQHVNPFTQAAIPKPPKFPAPQPAGLFPKSSPEQHRSSQPLLARHLSDDHQYTSQAINRRQTSVHIGQNSHALPAHLPSTEWVNSNPLLSNPLTPNSNLKTGQFQSAQPYSQPQWKP